MQIEHLIKEVTPTLDKIGVKYAFNPKIVHLHESLLEELTVFLIGLRDGPIAEWKKVRASQTEDQWAAYELYLTKADKEEFYECVLLQKAEDKVREMMRLKPRLMNYKKQSGFKSIIEKKPNQNDATTPEA